MKVCTLLVFVFLLSGCVTNALHFSPYTSSAELLAIKNQKNHSNIISVTGDERCTRCSERSKVVWHAANHDVGLYEGFANVPVNDWSVVVKQSIGSDVNAGIKTRVEINRIFVKTWSDPDYYACEANISVYVAEKKYSGHSRVKIKRTGQKLIRRDLVYLEAEALDAVSLALKAAYIEAFNKIDEAQR